MKFEIQHDGNTWTAKTNVKLETKIMHWRKKGNKHTLCGRKAKGKVRWFGPICKTCAKKMEKLKEEIKKAS